MIKIIIVNVFDILHRVPVKHIISLFYTDNYIINLSEIFVLLFSGGSSQKGT